MQLRGDERPVEALSRGCHCGVVVERAAAGDRGIRGDRRPVREGQVRAGLQRQEKMCRGTEDKGGHGVGGRSGDVGKSGSLQRCRQTAAHAVECNPGAERQCPAFHRAAGFHRDGLVGHYGPLEDGGRIKNRRSAYLPENVFGQCAAGQDDMNPAAHLKILGALEYPDIIWTTR